MPAVHLEVARSPIAIGDELEGSLVLRANPQSSYDASLQAKHNGAELPVRHFGIHGYFPWDPID